MIRSVLALLGASLLLATTSQAQQHTMQDRDTMIKNALSAAPSSISGGAKVMDWENNVLREGNNGWTCFPDLPATEWDDPMCLDEPWLSFIDAYVNKTDFKISRLGIGYMLKGEGAGSNVDPFAMEPTPDNEWIEHSGPHLMLIVPDARAFEGIPTDPHHGGPWVMWRNTPYAHIMVPVPEP